MPTLFDPLTLGALRLPNRMVMAPLTRCRASEGRVPNDLMRDYYVQRASAGLILTEATSVTPMGVGYPDTPGIWSPEQIDGWKRITDAVHQAGGHMVMQLWHVGRISHPFYLNGALPVAPSAIAAEGHVRLLSREEPYPVPRALETHEIPEIVAAFQRGALNAQTAGFDGVEIHAANGYLLDQFLQDHSNTRTDSYGGPIENRARLLLQVVDSVAEVWGADHVGVHLAPRGDAQSMGDSTPRETFGFIARALRKKGIAFLCLRAHADTDGIGAYLKQEFSGPIIANEGYTQETATELLASGEADAVAFGKLFISNPDLPERFRRAAPLNVADPATFYGQGPKGYTDYPAFS